MEIMMKEYGTADGGRISDRNSGGYNPTGKTRRQSDTNVGQRVPVKPAPKSKAPMRMGTGPVIHKPEHNELMRINKFLSDAGVCSRREADRLIEMGKVTVDGIPAEMGTRVLPSQHVCVNGKPVRIEEEEILLVVNKPIGIVCTTAEFDKDNIVDYINYPKRIYPIGRLDKDSSGLILMTNQGELVNKILRGGNHHEKEYMVRVNRPVTPEFVAAMEAGVVLDDGVRTLPCRVEKTGGYSFKIILMQGLNRQIRRMCETLDYRVTNLKRVRVMNIELGDLRVGSYRKVTPEEYAELRRRLEESTNLSWAEAEPLGLVRGQEIFPLPKEEQLPDRRPVGEKQPVPVKTPVSGKRPALAKGPVSERRLASERGLVSGKRPASEKRSFSASENMIRSESANKSVNKRGENKKSSGKNIVIRRPER